MIHEDLDLIPRVCVTSLGCGADLQRQDDVLDISVSAFLLVILFEYHVKCWHPCRQTSY